jgi:hypothetical protein
MRPPAMEISREPGHEKCPPSPFCSVRGVAIVSLAYASGRTPQSENEDGSACSTGARANLLNTLLNARAHVPIRQRPRLVQRKLALRRAVDHNSVRMRTYERSSKQ